MSGQPTPPRILEAFAKNAPDCTPAAPIAGGRTNPLPVASQIGITPGAASLDDGFTAQNMTDPAAGGIPPWGIDMNGILYLVSSWVAYLAAGQLPGYDATLQTAIGGYAKGSVLQQAANTLAKWVSAIDANMSDPDTTPATWVSSVPLYFTSAPAAGTVNNVVLQGASDYVWDVDTTAGALTITGFVAQRDGQKLFITTTGANLLTFSALNAGSGAANRIRLPADVSSLQNQTYVFQYSTGAGKWILV